MRRARCTIIGVVLAWSAGLAAWAQDSALLRPIVRLEAPRAVTVADVAVLTGPEAERLGAGVVVTEDECARRGPIKIDVERVRRASREVPGARPGSVLFSGGVCEIRVDARPEAPRPRTPEPPRAGTGSNVRDCVASWLADQFGVTPADLKLTFEKGKDDLLGMSCVGRRVAIRASGQSDTMPVMVRVYEGDRLLAEGSVRVDVLVRRVVPVAKATLIKGQPVRGDGYAMAERWVPPSLRPASGEELAAARARGRIQAGTTIETKDVEAAYAVAKGDPLSVDAVTSTLVVRMNNARALEAGREGDVILVEAPGTLSPKGKAKEAPSRFRARIVGPGRAVAVNDEPGGAG